MLAAGVRSGDPHLSSAAYGCLVDAGAYEELLGLEAHDLEEYLARWGWFQWFAVLFDCAGILSVG